MLLSSWFTPQPCSLSLFALYSVPHSLLYTFVFAQVDGDVVGSIGNGLVVLVGIEQRDTIDDIQWLAAKIWNIRLWPAEKAGKVKTWMESAAHRKYELYVEELWWSTKCCSY